MSDPPQSNWFRLEQNEGVLLVAFNRPPLNIMTIDMSRELERGLAAMDYQTVRVVLLYGEGRGFSAGTSIEDHLPEKAEAMLASFGALIHRVRSLPVPTIAVIHGLALGGGLELACAADILFAAEDARLGQPEIRLGAIAPIALVFLTRRLGYNRAADLLFSGREIDGRQAEAMGLVDFVYPASEVLEEARRYSRSLSDHSGSVLREYKQALLEASSYDRGELAEMGRFYLNNIVPQHDYVEGLSAFLQKRKPVWKDNREGGEK